MNVMMTMGMRDPNEIISPTLQDSINQITLQISTLFDEATAQQLMQMKPILIQIQLMGLERIKEGNAGTPREIETISTDHLVMPDLVLTEKAQAANLNIRGLETMEDQMNALFQIPMEVQWRALYNELIHPDTLSTTAISLKSLQAIYKQQDLVKLNQYIHDSELPTAVANELIVVRNYNMLNGIEDILQDQESVFFAVGAGHLGGTEGLIELLKKKNYQVKPIYFNWE
jgi:pheromone shutdown protein TraB